MSHLFHHNSSQRLDAQFKMHLKWELFILKFNVNCSFKLYESLSANHLSMLQNDLTPLKIFSKLQ